MLLHKSLPAGLALWLDFSATPKDQNGTYFPWIICDYPLAQAVEDRIVKAPLIVHRVDRSDPEKVTQDNVTEQYGEWLVAALNRWHEHYKTYTELGVKPVLFIMAEKNVFADKIGEWLVDKNNRTGLKEPDVLVIHTDSKGEITEKDLEKAREAARDIDKPENKVKAIVSVMMLREGWDVRGVSVVLGLRPFTSKARILPEQAVGRGLRLMQGISYDRTQTLEVMGTEAFEDFVRQLEMEGVGIKTTTTPPERPIIIAPVQEKMKYDIAIPLTRPVFYHVYKKLSTIDPLKLDPIYDRKELDEKYRLKLEMEYAHLDYKVHDEEIEPPSFTEQEILSQITNKTANEAKLTNVFADLYPLVKTYTLKRCFGGPIDLESENIRRHLSAMLVQEAIARYLAREISNLIAEKREIEFEDKHFKLSDTQKFTWRRKHLRCDHTIFNYVASYNDFESDFARFLDKSRDISRFASLAEHFTRFRVDYLSQSGAIRFYYPDFVAVQKSAAGKKVSNQFGEEWRYIRVDQSAFKTGQFSTFADLLRYIEEQQNPSSLF